MGTNGLDVTRSGFRYSSSARTYRIDKAKARLRYQPTVGIQEGIERGAKWWVGTKGYPEIGEGGWWREVGAGSIA